MRAFSNKFCNPTPFPVSIDWDRGITIQIEPFGETELDIAQVDDFRGDKPGWEAVRELIEPLGVFLLNPNESYDKQALTAIKKSIAAREMIYNAAYTGARDRRGAMGYAPDDNAIEEQMKQMKFDKLKEKISILKEQEKKLIEIVGKETSRSSITQLDPKRTIFVTDPPREFSSTTLMEFFLDMPENAEIKRRHMEFTGQVADEKN